MENSLLTNIWKYIKLFLTAKGVHLTRSCSTVFWLKVWNYWYHSTCQKRLKVKCCQTSTFLWYYYFHLCASGCDYHNSHHNIKKLQLLPKSFSWIFLRLFRKHIYWKWKTDKLIKYFLYTLNYCSIWLNK